MKIDLIDVIQDALIGGTNGDMAFKYNNHFIRTLFDRYEISKNVKLVDCGDNYEKAKFIEFLREALRDIDDEKRTK